jgi:hypothetical protein
MAGERKALKDYESALVKSGYGEFEIFVTEPSALLTLLAGNHVPWPGAKFLIFPFNLFIIIIIIFTIAKEKDNFFLQNEFESLCFRKPTTPNPTLFCFLDLCLGPTIQNPVFFSQSIHFTYIYSQYPIRTQKPRREYSIMKLTI